MVMISLFWGFVLLLAYTYVLYPVFALAAGRIRPRPVRRAPARPLVSIVIAAHNEERAIGETVANKLALAFPADRLEVIVVSDGSTDATDAIVQGIDDPRVRLIRQERRSGKTAALNRGVEAAHGEILVFADANSMYGCDALGHLVENFADPDVGYVTGRMAYVDRTGTAAERGCSTFIGYEHLLRTWEGRLGSIVGVNGGIDAMRRSLYVPMDPDALPDFYLPLHVVASGARVVYEPRAILQEDALATPRGEYRMRVRVILRAWRTVWEMRRLFNPRRYGVFALQLVSHKLLRFVAFAWLAALYATSIALSATGFIYAAACAAGTLFLVAAAAGALLGRRAHTSRALALPFYFVLVNIAAADALLRFLRGQRRTIWTPRLG